MTEEEIRSKMPANVSKEFLDALDSGLPPHIQACGEAEEVFLQHALSVRHAAGEYYSTFTGVTKRIRNDYIHWGCKLL